MYLLFFIGDISCCCNGPLAGVFLYLEEDMDDGEKALFGVGGAPSDGGVPPLSSWLYLVDESWDGEKSLLELLRGDGDEYLTFDGDAPVGG